MKGFAVNKNFKKEFGVDVEEYMYFDYKKFLEDHGIDYDHIPWYKADEIIEQKLGKRGYNIFKSLMEG